MLRVLVPACAIASLPMMPLGKQFPRFPLGIRGDWAVIELQSQLAELKVF